MDHQSLDYSESIEFADGIYWVGFADQYNNLHCSPYLIVDGDEAVLIDSGSRSDFSTVMLKIMRSGTSPSDICRLIYQHYDPDLCGNIPHMEAVIHNENLKIISHRENNLFIHYYSSKSPKECIEELGMQFTFSSGRRLEFILTPYAHAPGSFMTYDTKTRVLFSSDLFGSYEYDWSLYTKLGAQCRSCSPPEICHTTGKPCQLAGILNFHKRTMPSKLALDYALAQLDSLEISIIAPQHGSLLHTQIARELVIDHLRALPRIGIEHFLEEGRL